jgi:hypothetical protein
MLKRGYFVQFVVLPSEKIASASLPGKVFGIRLSLVKVGDSCVVAAFAAAAAELSLHSLLYLSLLSLKLLNLPNDQSALIDCGDALQEKAAELRPQILS